MKAKEYAERIINDNYSVESVRKVLNDMVQETGDIAKSRNVQSNKAMRAVIMEQQSKWWSICEIVNKGQKILLKEDGFLNVLKQVVPVTEDILLFGEIEKRRMARCWR